MESKHTPGPWGLMKLRDEPGWRLTPPDGRCVCFGVLPDEDAEDDANARLIVAAPELLAAVKEAHRLLPSLIHTSTDIDAVELGDAIERARAAIARAESR